MNRRNFLKGSSIGAAGILITNQMSQIKQTFAADLDNFNSKINGDFTHLRSAYQLSPDVQYFNHASIGTIPSAVQKARQKYLELCESNPWLYMWGGAWEDPREETRKKAAQILNCSPGEVALTHNTTEGFNILANGLPLGKGDEVVFSSMNHAGASVCWFHQAKDKGFQVNKFDFPVTSSSELSKQDVLDLYDRNITNRTRVLVFPHIDNIVGLNHPVRELTELARSKGVEFIAVDGAQAVGMVQTDMRDMDVDFYACSPHKWVQSPKGTGMLFMKKEQQLHVKPMWVTWGQNRWKGTVRIFEDYGTRNLAEVLALGDAIDFQQKLGMKAKLKHYEKLWEYFVEVIDNHPQLQWRSPRNWELSSSIYAVEVINKKSSELSQELFKNHGIIVRPFSSQGLNTLRISPNVFDTKKDLDDLVEILLAYTKA